MMKIDDVIAPLRLAHRAALYVFRELSWGAELRKNRGKGGFSVDAAAAYDLFVTHHLGGGSALYGERFLRSQRHCLLLRNYGGLRDALVLEHYGTGEWRRIKPDELGGALEGMNIKRIIVNSLVTYYCCRTMLETLSHLAREKNIPLVYLAHDYHCVCPRYNLIADGAYCQLDCARHRCAFNRILDWTREDIRAWRLSWGRFLRQCTEIRCFSESSREIIAAVYPDIGARQFTVAPHDMSHCAYAPMTYPAAPLCIGIIGACGTVPKGVRVVKAFLRHIRKTGGARVIVAGPAAPWTRVRGKNIIYTGAYTAPELPEILRSRGINAVLFPSVCPETFSYLVSELMLLDIPVVCFDYGAQAEKTRRYHKGIVCASRAPEDILRALRDAAALNGGREQI